MHNLIGSRTLLLHEKEAKKLLFETIEPKTVITGPMDMGLIIRKVYIGLVRITKDSHIAMITAGPRHFIVGTSIG